jgi:Phosphate transport regulator (distant homolog of PhoU)
MDNTTKNGFFKKGFKPNAYSMLTNQCEEACISSSLLVEFMSTLDKEAADKIEKTEKTADRKREDVINYVENSFITPLDRHDLFAVSRVIDDLTDEVKDLKDFILFFDYKPTEKNIEMARLSRDSIFILTDAMREWEDSDADKFWGNLVNAKKNENQVKRLYWENIKELEGENSVSNIITSREFCRDLNSLANKIGKASDRLGDLKIKSLK